MLDQAHDLRRLAIERSRPMTADSTARPTLLAVTGGKGGVGTTTIAINLATALAAAGKRPLLVDADPRGGDAALWCDIQERYTLADLLAGRRTWAEVIEPAAGGVRLVAGLGGRMTSTTAHRPSPTNCSNCWATAAVMPTWRCWTWETAPAEPCHGSLWQPTRS